MKEAIFMAGLPGSGKSTYINELMKRSKNNYTLVSADDLRLKHPSYDPTNPEGVHEDCVAMAEQMMYDLSENKGVNLIMDGGGINNSYTPRIIERVRKAGYKIIVIFIDTPVEICDLRNNDRVKLGARFVPPSAIIDKSYRLRRAVEKLSQLADKFEVVKYFTDDNVFFDLDGTVAEFQQLPKDEYGDINFVEYGVFKYSKPVMPVIERAEKLSKAGKRIFILSASPNSICNADKIDWVHRNMPFVKDEDIYFVGNKDFKYVFLYELINKFKFSPSSCMVVDDDHKVLETYSRLHINSMHISCFLTNY